jgi:hypothetical protein
VQDEGEGTLPCFLLEDISHVVIGVTGVDDQRQSGFPGCRDVHAKPLGLGVAWRLVVEIIKAGLADRHNFRVLCQPDQICGRHVEFFRSVVRMGADGAENFAEFFSDRKDLFEALHARRDRDHPLDARRLGARDDIGALLGEIGEVEMAMTVDQHFCRPQLSAACST